MVRDKETPLSTRKDIADKALGRIGYGSGGGSGLHLHLDVTKEDIERVKKKSLEIQQGES